MLDGALLRAHEEAAQARSHEAVLDGVTGTVVNNSRSVSSLVGAMSELLGDGEADVVPRAHVLATGVAQPDDQPVDLCPEHHLIVREQRR